MSGRTYADMSATIGDDGWTEWVQPVASPDHYRMACCTCGLVHNLEFRVVDGRAQFRASLNNRATGQMRRRKREVSQ